jgi:hypothetical protein
MKGGFIRFIDSFLRRGCSLLFSSLLFSPLSSLLSPLSSPF